MLEISLRQLETFVVTAECASFTRAADKLHLTQSTVSTHIQSLEQELDSQLILRGARRKLELTETGRRVYAAAKEILNRCEALESMRESSDAATLSIATSTVPAQQLLPKLMSGFLKKNNAARFALRRGDSDAVRTMLEKGEVRIGLMGAQPDPRRFISYPVAQDMLVMISENSPRFRTLKQQGATGIQLINEPILRGGYVRAENSCPHGQSGGHKGRRCAGHGRERYILSCGAGGGSFRQGALIRSGQEEGLPHHIHRLA